MNRLHLSIAILAAFLLVTSNALQRSAEAAEPLEGKEIYQNTLRSTALIISKEGSGTGWVVDRAKKLLITNYHVVATRHGQADISEVFEWRVESEVTVIFPVFLSGKVIQERKFYEDARSRLAIKGRVSFNSRSLDLAVIELDSIPDDVQELKMASEEPEPGDRVHTVGNPGASAALWLYTAGTVRSVHEKEFRSEVGKHNFKVIETQSPLNPGDSGGPVVNDQGQLVGVVQSLNPKGQLMSHCIAATEVKSVLAMRRGTRFPFSAVDHRNRGVQYQNKGQWDLAIAEFTKAIEFDPTDEDVYHGRGNAYAQTGQWERAFGDFDKAIELAPGRGDLYYERGLRYAQRAAKQKQRKDWNRAVEDYNQAIRLGYKNRDSYSERGLAYSYTKMYDWAIADFTKALSYAPSDASLHYSRGVSYGNRGNRFYDPNNFHRNNYARAVSDYQHCIEDYQNAIRLPSPKTYIREQAKKGIGEIAPCLEYCRERLRR